LLLRDVLAAVDNKKNTLAVIHEGKKIGTITAENIIHHLVTYHTK